MTDWMDEGTNAAIDAAELLIADGMPQDRAAALVAGMLKNGQEPIAAARHIVKLREALR